MPTTFGDLNSGSINRRTAFSGSRVDLGLRSDSDNHDNSEADNHDNHDNSEADNPDILPMIHQLPGL